MLDGAARVKPHAFSQYARLPKYPDEPWRHNSIDHHDREDFLFMGYSARSEGFRYTEWRGWNGSALQADWSDAGLVGVELYDHTSAKPSVVDYDATENSNLLSPEGGGPPPAGSAAAAAAAELSTALRTAFAPPPAA